KTKTPVFEADIEPLLKAKCLRCHGDKARKADLDLGTRAGILKGSESGPVIVPGKPAESKLYEMVHEGKMPPGNKDKLSRTEVETIRRWIEAAAGFGADKGQPDLAVPQHDVIPILLRRCTACHGRTQRENGLDLRTKASMLRGGKSGPAIVPGKPDASLLLKK